MKFFEDSVLQARKRHQLVCGDYYVCRRTPDATVVVLCDGIGSGVYANVAAITCGDRLMTMIERGRSLRSACEQVAESMHRARTEEMPFAAFIALRILTGGQFTAYAYENPSPILIRHDTAKACEKRQIAIQYETLVESSGVLELGDRLLLFSDGVTHAGIGGGFATGWEVEGVVQEVNAHFRAGNPLDTLLSRLLRTTFNISGKVYWDDTSLAMVSCREARQLALLTGPPANRADDARAIRQFMDASGRKVICGSTTTEIAARELRQRPTLISMDVALDSPPEYRMDGIDLITEGAVTLNQTLNLLEEEDIDASTGESPVLRLYRMLLEADVITLLAGDGYNAAQYGDTLLTQLGVKPRRRILRRIAVALEARGKLVVMQKL